MKHWNHVEQQKIPCEKPSANMSFVLSCILTAVFSNCDGTFVQKKTISPSPVSVLQWIWLRLPEEWMAPACLQLFSHMACCQSSNLSSRPSAGRGGVQRKPSPGWSATGGGECWALLPRVELMAVKLINGDESSEAASRFIPPGLTAWSGGGSKCSVTTCSLWWIMPFRMHIIRFNFQHVFHLRLN